MFKKIISLLSLLLIFVSVTAQTQVKKPIKEEDEDDKDTVPVRHVNRVEDKRVYTEWDKNKEKGEGLYKEFHTNKKLSLEGLYKNGKEVGVWKRYSESGVISDKIYHNATGEIDSTFMYNEKGKLIGEMRWKQSKKNGTWREYSSSGEIQKSETFKDNSLNGKTITYDKGNKYFESTYKAGTLHGPWIEYFDNGKPRHSGMYLNGEKNGEWKKFDEEGTVTETEKYVNGEVKE